MGLQFTFVRNSKGAGWQLYLGVGILSALAGYILSAWPQAIGPLACAGLAVWFIYTGLQENAGQAMVPSPRELARRFWALLTFWRGRLRSRWAQVRYGAGRPSRWEMAAGRGWQGRETAGAGGKDSLPG